jgi:RHS repeat-associated protein
VNSGTSKGKVKKITGFASNNNTQYEYNNRGLLQNVTETVDNIAHVTNYTYNVFGDVLTTTYPSGLLITNGYTSNGYLNTISGAGATLYTTTSMNGQGQVIGYNKGKTGTLEGKNSTISYTNGYATAYTTPTVQDYQFTWDYQKGNLTSRKDARPTVNKTETFLYDELDRLKSATVSGAIAFTATYSPNGNITSKKDLGTYHYDKVRFNATIGFDNPTVVVPFRQQDITYTAFNQPETITENNYLLTYTYGADYSRIKSELKLNGAIQNTRYYFSGGFEKDITGSTTRFFQYIVGPAGLVAIIESNGANHTPHYTYTDHLGSILTVTNSTGTIIEAEQSFDAWGRRRNPTTWTLASTQSTTLPVWLIRGYTGHEHLDMFGLINMNGRLYDPVAARMLSPDNYVQNPYGTQSYNRYSYAHNNPLVYTDPDGNNPIISMVIGAVIGGIVNGAMYDIQGKGFFQGFWRGAITGAVAGLTGYYAPIGAAGGLAYGAATGAVTGGIGAALNGSNVWRGAAWGAALGGVLGGISGAIEARQAGANWLTGARPDHYMLADGNIVAGSTPAPYSNEYLAKLKNTNYDDIEGVAGMSMTHRPSNIKVEGDYFITNIDKAEQALAVTRPHIWAHGNSSNVYFAKAAFRSKEQLSYTMAHEFGHVIHNSLGLGTLSNSKLGTPITGIDNEGHFAIGVMTNRLIKTNGWKGLGTFNFGYDQPMDNLYEPIKTLIRKIKLP